MVGGERQHTHSPPPHPAMPLSPVPTHTPIPRMTTHVPDTRTAHPCGWVSSRTRGRTHIGESKKEAREGKHTHTQDDTPRFASKMRLGQCSLCKSGQHRRQRMVGGIREEGGKLQSCSIWGESIYGSTATRFLQNILQPTTPPKEGKQDDDEEEEEKKNRFSLNTGAC